jgi:PhnB protein
MSVPPIPKGYHSVTPYIICKNAGEAIEFYKKAFGAKEIMRLMGGDKVMHADIQIGNSHVMIADEFPEMGAISPESLGGTPVNLLLYVEDVDTFAQRAVAAGIREVQPIQNQFYGDRSGCFVDPFGHRWSIATQVEVLNNEEVEQRFQKLVAGKKPE